MTDPIPAPKTTTLVVDPDRSESGFQLSDPSVESIEWTRKYQAILDSPRLSWIEHHRIIRRLGSGGQGIVFLTQKFGADGFTLPVALKVFSPSVFAGTADYDDAMAKMASVASRIALIQQDNLIDVHNVLSLDHVRVLEMEWIDGYDLQYLLSPASLERIRQRVDDSRWGYLNNVILTPGGIQTRLKAGVAIAVIRDILAALSPLHREGIIHGDIKPANIMLKKTGNAKLIDIGSAFACEEGARPQTCTPAYSAPEILEGGDGSPRSDLASVGYLLVELLSGVLPFSGLGSVEEHIAAKRSILWHIREILPGEVTCNDLLMELICRLIAPDPADRFPSAEAAEFVDRGAANFHRQLVQGNLASEYPNEIRLWLQDLESPN